MTATTLKDFPRLYCDTWQAVIAGSIGCDALSRFFNLPCHMIHADGSHETLSAATDLIAFNEQRRAAFLQASVTTARLAGSDLTTQGSHVALITANWELLRGNGTLERSWRHHYTMIRPAESWVILVSTFQPGA